MAITLNGSSSVVTNSGAVYDGIQRGTAVTASGTSVDFTSIPSWVKRITVMFNGVSLSGSSNFLIQLGDSGGIETTGYSSVASRIVDNAVAQGNSTSGYILSNFLTAALVSHGHAVLTNISGNVWVLSALLGTVGSSNGTQMAGGSKETSATLDRIRITTVNGTDTFDAGSINILYE